MLAKSILLKSVLVAAYVIVTITPCSARELTYSSFLPTEHIIHTKAIEPYFHDVREQSHGDLDWKVAPGGVLGNTREALSVIQDGVADGGIVLDVYIRDQLPITSSVDDLYTLADDFIAYAAAANEYQLVACDDCIDERAKRNLISFAYYGPDPYLIMCTGDVSTHTELQKKKVLAANRVGQLVREFGAVPVSLTSTEIYDALQRGQVDCGSASAAWLTAYNLHDIIHSIIKIPMGSYFNALAFGMNKRTFDDLSKENKEIIIDNLAKLVANSLYAYKDEASEALADAEENGVKIYPPDEEMVKILQEFNAKEIERAKKASESKKIRNGEQKLEQYLNLVKKWKKLIKSNGQTRDELIKILNQEIYSKVKMRYINK